MAGFAKSLTENILLKNEKIFHVFDIAKPNLMYGYAIEWAFGDL